MTSPFSLAAPLLREQGYSVLTIMPGDKAPGSYSKSAGWTPAFEWQRFCERLPTEIEMSFWEKWPEAGVGVALGPASAPAGLQLVALDIDTDDSTLVQAILAVVPPSPVRKRGRKGQTLFFLAPLTVENRGYNVDGGRILDLLTNGRQTLLPPSLHPCGEPYHWITPDTLEDTAPEDLPMLPDDIGDRLSEALAPFGVTQALVSRQGESTIDTDSPFRSLNDKALADLDSWVPALQLHGCYRNGHNYRAVPHWRASSSGRPIHQRQANLSIAPEGIRDFGGGGRESYTPLDLVMAACGADVDTAFRWLQDRVAPVKPIVLNLTKPVIDPAGSEEEINANPLPYKALDPVPSAEEIGADVPPAASPPGLIPAHLCTPAGLVGDVVTWMNAASERPSPQMNLAAALCWLGALMGRRYSTPTNLRSNLYMVAIAPSGSGKSFPINAINTLSQSCNLSRFMGGSKIRSESGLRKMLEAKPTVVMQIDELGGELKKILSRKASSHESGIRDMILSLFSAAGTVWMGSEGAVERAEPITNPCLCLFGATTPVDLWTAVSSSAAEDGLLARWLLIDGGEPTAGSGATMDINECPHRLRQRILEMMDVHAPGNLNAVSASSKVRPIAAQWGEGAELFWREMAVHFQNVGKDCGPAQQSVYNRVAEHTMKLALILAVGQDFHTPVISISALEWAYAIVEHSTTTLIEGMEGRIASNDRQAEFLRVMRLVKEKGERGVTERDLIKTLRGEIDMRRYKDICEQLVMAGQVEKGIMTIDGKQVAGVRWTG